MNQMTAGWTLFYDGGCNLCHASKLRVERWAEARGVRLRAEILQSNEALEKGYGDAMTLEIDGRVLKAHEAWLELMRLAPFPLSWVAVLRFSAVTRWVAGLGYGIVARLRYRLFGRRACPLP